MAIIGTFKLSKEGGWIGYIRTLTIDCRVRFVPNDNRKTDPSPDYRIYVGGSEIGAAWRTQTNRTNPYLNVLLDDPSLLGPLNAALIEAPDGLSARLLWGRRRQ